MDFVLAQAASPDFGAAGWIQFGALGLIVVAFMTGQIVPRFILDRKEKEVEELRRQNEELRRMVQDQIIPALTRTTDALSKYGERDGR